MIPGSSSCEGGPTTGEPLAAAYLRERRLSMSDCLEVLESDRFRKTRKKRAAAWQNNQPPSIHTTLGAFQRGPWTGLTTATARHEGRATTFSLSVILREVGFGRRAAVKGHRRWPCS